MTTAIGTNRAGAPLRVVFFHAFFGSGLTGGPRQLATLIHLLGPRIEPMVVTQRPSALTELLAARGVPYHIVPLPEAVVEATESRHLAALQTPRVLAGLYAYNSAVGKVAAPHRPHVWWGRHLWSVLLSRFAAGRLGVPFVLDVAMSLRSGGGLARSMTRAAYGAALLGSARVVLEADALRRQVFGPMAALAGGRVVTVPIGLDPARIAMLREAGARRRGRRANDRLTVLVLGSITPRKNQALLIEALHVLGRDAARLRVVIAGDVHDTAYAAALAGRIASLGFKEGVTLTGWHDDVPALMADADLLVHCALAEGLTHVVREAAFARLPVIATAVGGISDVVEDGVTGRLVSPDDPYALAAALRRALDDPDAWTRLADAARQRADRWHVPEAWVDRYAAVLVQASRVGS